MSTTLIIVIGLVAIIALYLFYNLRRMKNLPEVTDSPMIKVLTDKNFQHQTKDDVTLVDFWASWCIPCKLMAPVINEVAEELDGKAYVGKLDVERYQAVAAKYKIRNIPTMVLFKDGKEISRFTGAKSKDFLLKQIDLAK